MENKDVRYKHFIYLIISVSAIYNIKKIEEKKQLNKDNYFEFELLKFLKIVDLFKNLNAENRILSIKIIDQNRPLIFKMLKYICHVKKDEFKRGLNIMWKHMKNQKS